MDAALATRKLDIKVISLIGVAHFLSHCYQLALPALFPIIYRVEGIGIACSAANGIGHQRLD